MPSKGVVTVRCSSAMARITAQWLERDFETRRPTLLGDHEIEEKDQATADDLAEVLMRKARRARRGEAFGLELPRELADWLFGVCFHLRIPALPQVTAPPAVFTLARLCGEALNARRNLAHRRLSRADLEQRIADRHVDKDGDREPDQREIRRLQKRLNTEQLVDEIRRSGHTLLTWPGWQP